MKTFFLAILGLTWGVCSGKSVDDPVLEFSVLVPDSATVDVIGNETGRSAIVAYHNAATGEAFIVNAVRSNNGGFGTSHAAVVARAVEGTTARLGKSPAYPVRTLKYGLHELYIAQYIGVGTGAAQTLTTIFFVQERGTWRKIIVVQIVSTGIKAPSDEHLLERLKAAHFRPAA